MVVQPILGHVPSGWLHGLTLFGWQDAVHPLFNPGINLCRGAGRAGSPLPAANVVGRLAVPQRRARSDAPYQPPFQPPQLV